jgi:GTP cyclohydrolase III
MNQITNTIQVEYEHFLLEVDYDWRKGNAGDYYNAPQPNETDINKVVVIAHIDYNGYINYLDKEIKFETNIEVENTIMEEIEYDIENWM